jgi:hypothetical protein
MADKDDQAAEEQEAKDQEGVEATADETQGDTEQPAEDATEETSEEADDAQDEGEDFERRFTQFKGETIEEYTKNLETAYANSSSEALNLKKRADDAVKLIATDPAAADKVVGAQEEPVPTAAPKSAAEAYAETKMREEQTREYDEFVKEHSELESDPALADRLLKELGTFSAVTWQNEGRLIGMNEGLTKAWNSLGLGNNSEEDTRVAAKEGASQSKTSSRKKAAKKEQFTENQIKVAMKMDPDKTRAQVIEDLAKYAK